MLTAFGLIGDGKRGSCRDFIGVQLALISVSVKRKKMAMDYYYMLQTVASGLKDLLYLCPFLSFWLVFDFIYF